MRIAYADPPYLGCGAKHYGRHHTEAADCDDPEWHRCLILRLCDEFPDGWALSCTSGNLQDLLPMAPCRVRVAAWVKPFAAFKVGVNPAYAWEPVIWRGGRQPRGRDEATVRDWLAEPITLRKGLTGAKPAAFACWLFQLLGLRPGDEFVDLFPGTGAVGEAWQAWQGQLPARQDQLFAEVAP